MMGEITDPRLLARVRQHWALPYKQLLIRLKNNFGLSIIEKHYSIKQMYGEQDLYEAALIRFNSEKWGDYDMVHIEDDIFDCVTREEILSLIPQIEMLSDAVVNNK